VNESGGRARI